MKKLDIKYKYSQQDPRWKNKTLGTKGTIGRYGCLLTSLAMVSSYYGFIEDPDTLNNKLKANSGYVNGNLYVWGGLSKIHSKISFKNKIETPRELTKAQMDQIRGMIDKGYPVITQIDSIPATSALDEHWVMIYGYDGDDFLLIDSWDGKEKRITDWGFSPQKMIWAYIIKEGTPNVQPVIDYCKDINEFLVSVGYTYPEAHLDVIKVMHESDQKLKSGDYVLKIDCEKECNKQKDALKKKHEKDIENLKSSHVKDINNLKDKCKRDKKEAIDETIKNETKKCKKKLDDQAAEYEEVINSTAYKVAQKIIEFLEGLNIIKKTGGGN